MSSTVFYKFFHQKGQSAIHFDGTGITVFDLKHEIIMQNHLGEGNDFNLRLYHLEQPDSEYENDQDVIARSSFVLAKRSPSYSKNGKFNNASRYVSGKPRINKNVLANVGGQANLPTKTNTKLPDENVSEEDRIKMMFENQSDAWARTQDELSTHRAIYNKPSATSTNPEDIPPPGYMCYRCGAKDHWIRNCPTNTDPNFEGKKIKRTTGIPKSYLKTIPKELVDGPDSNGSGEAGQITTNENGELVDQNGNAYMVTDTGEYAIAIADSKTWLNYQQKQQNAAMKAKSDFDSKVIDCMEKENRLEFLDPLVSPNKKILEPPIVYTPCCNSKEKLKNLKNFNYNQRSLEQLLIDNDFHCPNCGAEDVYIDSLIPNRELEESLHTYIQEKEKQLGIEDPVKATKRSLEKMEDGDHDGVEEGDSNRAKKALPFKPIPPMGPVPFGVSGGMPMPPMPPMPVVMNPNMPVPPPPMFMPPPPMSSSFTPNNQGVQPKK